MLRSNECAVYTTCVILLSTCQSTQTWTINQIDAVPREMPHSGAIALHGVSYNDASHETIKGRETRAVTGAAKSVAALEKLLTSAKKVHTPSKNYILYRREGNLQTAMDDFYSMNPVWSKANPKRRKFVGSRGRSGQEALLGQVGNKRLILMPYGDKYSKYAPVLEIRSNMDPFFDRIVYKYKEN